MRKGGELGDRLKKIGDIPRFIPQIRRQQRGGVDGAGEEVLRGMRTDPALWAGVGLSAVDTVKVRV